MLTDADIRSGLGDALSRTVSDPAIVIERAVADSRLCRPGDLFVALPGETLDGNRFLEDAYARGASAVLASRASVEVPAGRALYQVADPLAALQRLAGWWRGRFNLRVLAVTGTAGKTSTKEIAAHVLARRGCVLKTESSLNGEIGLPLMLLRLRPEHEIAVLELGLFWAGEIRLQCDLARPRYGIVTNVGHTHASRLGSIDAIALAKREMVEWLPPEGVVALNADDPRVAAMAAVARCRVVRYGLRDGVDVRADQVRDFGLDGFSFRLHARGESVTVRTPLIGRHNVSNCLAVAAIALEEGLSPVTIAAALADARNSLRLRHVPGPNGSTLIDDTYNAGSASNEAALDLLDAVPVTGRRIAVLGDMFELGDAEEHLHRELGARVARSADIAILAGERMRWTAEAARAHGGVTVQYLEDPAGLVAAVLAVAGPGDLILLKASRGMAFERVVEALGAVPRSAPVPAGSGAAVVAQHPAS